MKCTPSNRTDASGAPGGTGRPGPDEPSRASAASIRCSNSAQRRDRLHPVLRLHVRLRVVLAERDRGDDRLDAERQSGERDLAAAADRAIDTSTAAPTTSPIAVYTR